MKLTRNAFIATGSLTALASSRPLAKAAEYTYRLSCAFPAADPMPQRLVAAAAAIKQDSNGRFEIQVFPANQLGNSTSTLTQVRAGALEFAVPGDNILGAVIPAVAITWVPYIFLNAKEGYDALAGPLGKYLRGLIAQNGMHAFERPWPIGFRQIINNRRPITTPDDLRGLKMEVPESAVMFALFKALGSTPTAIPSADMYTSLQTHVVDGIDLPISTVESFKIYEVQKYLSYTNHAWTTCTLVCNTDAWERLPKQLQDIAARRIDEAALLYRDDIARDATTAEAKLRTLGMEFNQADVRTFVAAVRKAQLYSQWRQLYGDKVWSLLPRSVQA